MTRTFDEEKAMTVYRTMIEYQLNTGFNMTMREIADAVGYNSTSTAHHYVSWLVQQGMAEVKGRQVRAIKQDERVRYQ